MEQLIVHTLFPLMLNYNINILSFLCFKVLQDYDLMKNKIISKKKNFECMEDSFSEMPNIFTYTS